MSKNNRDYAWEIVDLVINHQAFSNKLLQNLKSKNVLSQPDMAFVTKLVYGTIQYKIYFEYITNKIIDENKTPSNVKVLLYLALEEYLHWEKPAYVVVNEYVELAKRNAPNYSRFINKVLRDFTTNAKLFRVDIKNKKNKLPLENGIAFWMYQKIANDYGEENAKKMVAHINDKKQNSFRINTLKSSSKPFYDQLNINHDFTPSKIARDCFVTELNLIGSEIFQSGLIYAQDQCSVLVGQIVNPALNSKVLDMCCAPGGKMTHLAALMQNTGKILGTELRSEKISLVQENIKRLGVTNCVVLNQDALMLEENDFDIILVDAPCSGLGVLRQKPEIRLKKPNVVLDGALVTIQEKLLEKASDLLKKDGILVYSTCTINKDENQNQIRNFLTRHPDFKIVEEHQFFGFEYNTDGFYICKLQRSQKTV